MYEDKWVMRYLFVAPMDVDEPIDAEWTQEEKTERIVTIEDSEVEWSAYICWDRLPRRQHKLL